MDNGTTRHEGDGIGCGAGARFGTDARRRGPSRGLLMTRLGRIAGIVGVSLAGSLLGCNSILGIDIATPEPGDAQGGSGASGTSGSTSGVASEGGTSGTTTGSSGA